MPLTPAARRVADQIADEAITAQKARYRERLLAIEDAFAPPLTHGELSAGLGTAQVAEGRVSDVGRWVSEKPRLRRSRPDAATRALIDAIVGGELLVAAGPLPVGGGRRQVLVCLPSDVPWFAPEWQVVDLSGKPAPKPGTASAASTGGAAEDLEDDAIWDAFADGAEVAPAPEVVAAPTGGGTAVTVGRAHGQREVAGRLVSAIGLGAMRLSTRPRDERPREDEAVAVLHAALDAGITLLDTADSYGLDDAETGHNERLVAKALASWSGAADDVLVVTKAGLRRPGGRWVPDGRPEHLEAACEASLRALGREALDLYLLHVVDKRVPLADSVGALARLVEVGKVLHVGLCNVDAEQLDAARAIVPIAAVQNEHSVLAGAAVRGGLAARCHELGVPLLAHRPLGGHAKVGRVARDRGLVAVAERLGATPHEVALAWLLALGPGVVPLPGATRLDSVASIARALRLHLSEEDLVELERGRAWATEARAAVRAVAPPAPDEVVIVMGSPASGKTSTVRPLVARGYARLNRDDAGGRLRDLVPALESALAEGARRVVLDNTYPTRASRAEVVHVASAAGVPVRCVHIDIPREEALFNAAQRLLERRGRMLSPEELKAAGKQDPNLFPPGAIDGFWKRFEAPDAEAEGFAGLETVAFQRRPEPGWRQKAVVFDYDGTLRTSTGPAPFPRKASEVALLPGRKERLDALAAEGWLLLGVSNQAGVALRQMKDEDVRACMDRTHELLGRELDVLWCPHRAGYGHCWCRKPMPGLGVVLIHRYGLDRSRCVYVGDRDSDRGFAQNVGFRFEDAEAFFGRSDIQP